MRNLLAFVVASTVIATKIRGVADENLARYKPDEDGLWACLSAPQVRIPLDRINDDYCDCPDGSDEPGTSACSGRSLAVFHCENLGHIPRDMPASRVNDGVCDYEYCCDGSDEWKGLVSCPNKCAEMAKQYKVDQAAERDRQRRGGLIKQQWLNKAKILKTDLQQQLAKANQKLLTANVALEQARIEANGDVVDEESVTAAVGRAVSLLEKYRDRVTMLESMLNNLEQEPSEAEGETAADVRSKVLSGLKAYRRSFPADAAEEESPEAIGAELQDLLLDLSRSDYRSGSNSLLVGLKRKLREVLEKNGILPGDETTANKSKKSAKKNRQVESAEEAVKKAQTIVDDLSTKLEDRNTGPDDLFLALEGICFSSDMGEYEYEICITGSASQTGKSSRSSTSLGSFKGNNEGFKFRYEDGAKCWNGPARSVEVTYSCGPENKILSVHEPEKCFYAIKAMSPLACNVSGDKADHDEL
ncbi:hypothetical protein CANCADRAFT_55720 [Tortispora caseinolytica NRRL Y-17796]|uniref:Glucosidase 2 subunit beta n=1 Tax=Tortispora caseinolytica NRRL Y-17796 TaxID=767744 RepID=A0A1E4TJP1_9ASCO|nr:hypothetical protein CANCADRAFT_55720 [Tortispora caseinolytica NRRL Y-17796]